MLKNIFLLIFVSTSSMANVKPQSTLADRILLWKESNGITTPMILSVIVNGDSGCIAMSKIITNLKRASFSSVCSSMDGQILFKITCSPPTLSLNELISPDNAKCKKQNS